MLIKMLQSILLLEEYNASLKKIEQFEIYNILRILKNTINEMAKCSVTLGEGRCELGGKVRGHLPIL